jgi:hypothetical protein
MARVAWSVQRTTSSTSHTLYLTSIGCTVKNNYPNPFYIWSAAIPRGSHPFPSRTRSLSLAGRMVLHERSCGRVRRRRPLTSRAPGEQKCLSGAFMFCGCIPRAGARLRSSRILRSFIGDNRDNGGDIGDGFCGSKRTVVTTQVLNRRATNCALWPSEAIANIPSVIPIIPNK